MTLRCDASSQKTAAPQALRRFTLWGLSRGRVEGPEDSNHDPGTCILRRASCKRLQKSSSQRLDVFSSAQRTALAGYPGDGETQQRQGRCEW